MDTKTPRPLTPMGRFKFIYKPQPKEDKKQTQEEVKKKTFQYQKKIKIVRGIFHKVRETFFHDK